MRTKDGFVSSEVNELLLTNVNIDDVPDDIMGTNDGSMSSEFNKILPTNINTGDVPNNVMVLMMDPYPVRL